MRPLRLTSPYAQGADVRELQRGINRYAHDHPRLHLARVKVDGEYGPNTHHAVTQIAYLAGIGTRVIDGAVKPWVQRLILHPTFRNPIQRARSRRRRKHAREDAHSAQAVIAWEKSKLGTVEHPANSNRGAEISLWQRDVAGIDGQPWCGAFQGYALKHIAGLPVLPGIVYTPNIINYAKTGTGGFESWHPWSERQPGDLVLFKWPGISSAPCDHVGLCVDEHGHTLEGNTSSGSTGSQNNGGGVYLRDRQGYGVVGCARPRYA